MTHQKDRSTTQNMEADKRKAGTMDGYDSKDDLALIDGKPYETSAISAVKNLVSDSISEESVFDEDESRVSNGIELADQIINALLGAGVLIPSDIGIKDLLRARNAEHDGHGSDRGA